MSNNNETIGITAEYLLCVLYNIEHNINKSRINDKYFEILNKCLIKFKKEHQDIEIIKHTGGDNGSSDFSCKNNLVLSLKTNINKNNKVCPQKIGQPTKKRFIKFWGLSTDSTIKDIKSYIYTNCCVMIPTYFENLFCCDYLIWLFKDDFNWKYKLYNKKNKPLLLNKNSITFTRPLEKWNEGITVKYNNTSIGEFQIHKNRDCIKFRFFFLKFTDLFNIKSETINI